MKRITELLLNKHVVAKTSNMAISRGFFEEDDEELYIIILKCMPHVQNAYFLPLVAVGDTKAP